MPAGRRVWLKGDGFKVYLTNRETLEHGGRDYYGWLEQETGNIEIAGKNPELIRKTAFHELIHKALFALNPKTKEDIFGDDRTEEQYEDQEEQLCRLLEDKLYDLLSRNGWLKFPKPPRFK